MPFDQLKQLSDLVGFCLAPHFLEVEELGNAWMRKNVVTSLSSCDPEAECFRQPDEIAKPHIVRGHNDSLEQFSRSHPTRNPERLTGEYAGQHIPILALPTTAAILSGFRELVKVLPTPLWPTNTDQHNPIRAATDRASRSMPLPGCGPLSHIDLRHGLNG